MHLQDWWSHNLKIIETAAICTCYQGQGYRGKSDIGWECQDGNKRFRGTARTGVSADVDRRKEARLESVTRTEMTLWDRRGQSTATEQQGSKGVREPAQGCQQSSKAGQDGWREVDRSTPWKPLGHVRSFLNTSWARSGLVSCGRRARGISSKRRGVGLGQPTRPSWHLSFLQTLVNH